jgi:hypothetical protein
MERASKQLRLDEAGRTGCGEEVDLNEAWVQSRWVYACKVYAVKLAVCCGEGRGGKEAVGTR